MKRYDMAFESFHTDAPVERENGDYCLFSDYVAALQAERDRREADIVRVRTKLESLITQRIGMQAENMRMGCQGIQPYNGAAFSAIADRMDALLAELAACPAGVAKERNEG